MVKLLPKNRRDGLIPTSQSVRMLPFLEGRGRMMHENDTSNR